MTKEEEFLEEFFTVADARWIEEFLPQVILDTIENKEEFVQGKMSAETEWLLKGYVRDSSIKKIMVACARFDGEIFIGRGERSDKGDLGRGIENEKKLTLIE